MYISPKNANQKTNPPTEVMPPPGGYISYFGLSPQAAQRQEVRFYNT